MTCRHCGTEIAERAIVCYRCGTATSVPTRQPSKAGPRPGRLIAALALVALVLAALFMGQAAWSDDVPVAVPYTVAAIAVLVLSWRLAARFGRRK